MKSSNTLQNFAFYTIDQTMSDSLDLTFKSDRASLIRSLDGFRSSLLAVAAKANEVLPLWRCATREPSANMHRGRLVLAGDAAHAMLPHLGQGAAQSIEDAAALGVLLQGIPAAGSAERSQSIEARLKLFEEVRSERVASIQILSEVPGVEDGFDKALRSWKKHLPELEFPSMSLPQNL